jgi:hypothetical protein
VDKRIKRRGENMSESKVKAPKKEKKAILKKVCLKCGYWTGTEHHYYKCFCSGCPAKARDENYGALVKKLMSQ